MARKVNLYQSANIFNILIVFVPLNERVRKCWEKYAQILWNTSRPIKILNKTYEKVACNSVNPCDCNCNAWYKGKEMKNEDQLNTTEGIALRLFWVFNMMDRNELSIVQKELFNQ